MTDTVASSETVPGGTPGGIIGVNVPYLGGAYGHDLAPNGRFPDWPCAFDPMTAYRPLLEARSLGFTAARVWLCENGEGITVDAVGAITGVHPRLLESVKVLQECASLAGLRLYWTLLDANAYPREGDPITRAVLGDPAQTQRFAECVVAPLVRAMDPAVTLAVEVVNEPEVSTAECLSAGGAVPLAWDQIGTALRTVGDCIRAERPGTLVTAGTMHVFLPRLWRAGAGLTAVDVHVYHPNGGMPSREDLAAYVGDPALRDPSLPLFAGECGIPKDTGTAVRDPDALTYYIFNADRLGYAAAFLWQLEGDLIDRKARGRPVSDLGVRVARVLAERVPR